MESVGSKKSKGIYEHFYRKYNAEVSVYVKIAHAAAFRHRYEPQKQFVDSGSFTANMGEYV